MPYQPFVYGQLRDHRIVVCRIRILACSPDLLLVFALHCLLVDLTKLSSSRLCFLECGIESAFGPFAARLTTAALVHFLLDTLIPILWVNLNYAGEFSLMASSAEPGKPLIWTIFEVDAVAAGVEEAVDVVAHLVALLPCVTKMPGGICENEGPTMRTNAVVVGCMGRGSCLLAVYHDIVHC